MALVLGIRALSSADALGTIEGTIRTGGAPASVTVVCGTVSRSARTDSSGHFSIGGLPAGSCTLTASASGFTAQASRVTITAGGAATISMALSASAPVTKDPVKAEPKADKPGNTRVMSPSPAMAPPPPVGRMAKQALIMDGDPAHNTEAYARIDDNPFHRVATAPLSTFSADVDTASYSNTRRFLRDGKLPPKDAVRIEELINYFTYDYPQPAKGEPFSITTEVTASPWNAKLQLVRIGLKAPAIDDAQVPARNLVFLLDVSGSMSDANKLPLLKQAMNLLVNQLRPQDKIAIVTYAGNAGLALPATSGREKDTIRNAIFRLEPGGSTNGAAGIQLAYDLAEKNSTKGAINRVILATDGDFNVGTTSEGDLSRLIEKERERGVFLTVLGFGMGNTKDSTMEKLADRGNGNYAYIDTIDEARKVLVKEAGATLVTVAKDVKLQVEFNPALVAGYRLLGYENRLLKDEDFNDDKKDAGEIGAGHAVTALYEIVPAGVPVPAAKVDDLKYQTKPAPNASAGSGELLTVKVRYKAPDGKTSKLLSRPLANQPTELAKASADLRWAAAIAGFGMMLRESPHRGNLTWKQVEVMAQGALGKDTEGYRAEAVKMITAASKATR
ncbi:MAG: von Willebrand factor type A domain-containing protein [Myxococcales bacterium]|nr:von Willebrand factor type A domain-containing protein [Myxococcales bacterium]